MAEYLPVFTSPQGEAEVMQAYQAVLAQWPVPFAELDVPTSYGQVHVIAGGPESAPPVVLLHAFFATAMSWYQIVGALSQHYRVYAVDVLGEANKSRPFRPLTSLDDYLCCFTELIDGLGVREMHLVGNSFGGFTATYYAMHLPERVRKLVLIGPAATFRRIPQFYIHMFIPKALTLLFPWLPGRKPMMRHAVNWARAGLPSDLLWERLFYLVMVHGGSVNQVFPRVFTETAFAQIEAPTLLLLGDRERIYPSQDAARQARRLMPTIQVEIIPQAHHITAVAQPRLVNSTLLRFFQDGGGDSRIQYAMRSAASSM